MTPVLYIIMRSDLASLNPGKLAAQACHGANMMTDLYYNLHKDYSGKKHKEMRDNLKELYELWSGSRGFGTTIILDGKSGDNLQNLYEKFSELSSSGKYKYNGALMGTIDDPEYPIRDGQHTHLVPLTTGIFVFGNKDDFVIKSLLGGLSLYA